MPVIVAWRQDGAKPLFHVGVSGAVRVGEQVGCGRTPGLAQQVSGIRELNTASAAV
jgi:hypothetical protein